MSMSDVSWKTTSPTSLGWTAGALALPLPMLDESVSYGDAYEWFLGHSDQRAAAVVDADGKVKGIANRLRFLSRCATGVGMAPEMIPIALEPFRQIDSALARKFEGTGLGLSLVKTLVECHDGRLEIESALHCGTTVRVRFPASPTCTAEGALMA